jgi:predicted kinase
LAQRRLRERQQQGGDASEANASVLEQQLQDQHPFTPDEAQLVLKVDMTNTIDFEGFWSQLQSLLANRNS